MNANSSTNQSNSGSNVKNILIGNLCIFVATLFFGIDIPVVKLLIPHWMTAMDVTAFRMIGACACFWILSLFVKTEKIERKDWVSLLLGGCIGLFFFIFLFNLALHFSNPIDVSIIMTMPPAFVVIINVLFKGERPTVMEIVGLVVSFIGAFIVIALQHSSAKGSNELLGDLLALTSSVCYAYYLVVTEKPSKKYRPATMLKWIYLAASIPAIFLIPGLCSAPIWHTSEAKPWLLIGFVVVFVSFISYFLMAPAEKKISSTMVSIYQYLVPVIATIASVILGLAEVKIIQVVAMVVIIAGMLLTNVAKFRQSKAHIARLQAHGIASAEEFSSQLSGNVTTIKNGLRNLEKSVDIVVDSASADNLSAFKIAEQSRVALAEVKKMEQALESLSEDVSVHLNDAEKTQAADVASKAP